MSCHKILHLCVFRVRPRDLDEDERSDGDIDDEELILTKHDLKEVLNTRVGGHHTQGDNKTTRKTDVKPRMKNILNKL